VVRDTYHRIEAIEITIDLANHLISMNRWRSPEDYAGTFTVPGSMGSGPGIRQAPAEDGTFQKSPDPCLRKDRLHIMKHDIGDIRRFLDAYLAAVR
jgi:hypothetical protein